MFFEEVLQSDTFGFVYNLQAVAVHKRPFGSGHYVAYVRDSHGQWVLVDDEAAPVVVPFHVVQRKQAYVLLYALVSAR